MTGGETSTGAADDSERNRTSEALPFQFHIPNMLLKTF